HGILLSSPSLDRYLPTYLAADPLRLSKRARRIERSLLEYLYRAAAKTSPFSTLTAVELAGFDGDGPDLVTATLAGPAKRAVVQLNLAVLARLTAVLLGNGDLRADLPVRATGGVTAHRERIRYLRRLQTVGSDDGADGG